MSSDPSRPNPPSPNPSRSAGQSSPAATAATPVGPSGGRKAAIGFILVTVTLDVISLGIIIPVLPKLVESMLGGDTPQAARVLGLFSMTWALMQLLFSPVIGALSDTYGRRPVLLLSAFGLGLDYVLMALAPTLALLFLGRVIAGITAATISTATAYIADVTPAEDRSRRFGLIGAAFGVGFVVGPAIGGLLGSTDPRLPFWVAAAFTLLNVAYGYFVLPESLPAERRAPFKLRSANPLGALRLLRSDPKLFRLAGALFLYHLAHAVLPALFVLYAGYRYQWDARTVGLSLAVFGVAAAIVQGGLIRPVVGRIGERNAMLLGLGMGTIAMVTGGLATTSPVFFAGMVMLSLWGFVGPASQGLMTQLVSPSEQGRLQGAGSSLMGLANLIGPLLFSFVFAAAIAPERSLKLPGLPMLLAALMLVGAAILVVRATTEPTARPPAPPLTP